MSQPPNPTLTIRLTLEQINTVLQHLHSGAYATVAPVIGEITLQSEQQLSDIRAAIARRASAPAEQPDLPGVPPAEGDAPVTN